jgi:hypothetical protein
MGTVPQTRAVRRLSNKMSLIGNFEDFPYEKGTQWTASFTQALFKVRPVGSVANKGHEYVDQRKPY